MYKIEIQGNNYSKGKNILVMSGVHGDELTPVYCSYLLSKKEFNLNSFKKLTIISSINPKGVEQNTREMPSNHTSDLNRMFDSSDYIDIKGELKNLFDINDVIIDIHSSPKCDDFVLLNQDEVTNSYVNFCNKLGIHYLIRYSNSNTIKKYCLDKGKISFTLELNQMSYIDKKSAHNGVDIILNIIQNINSLKLQKEEPHFDDYIELKTYKKGLLIPRVSCGDIIKEGYHIADIIDLETFNIESINLKNKGMYRVICFGVSDYIDANKSVCFLQPL